MGPPHDFKQSAGKRNLPENQTKVGLKFLWTLLDKLLCSKENQTKVGLKFWRNTARSFVKAENQTKVGLKFFGWSLSWFYCS